jgi:hypothetical protein
MKKYHLCKRLFGEHHPRCQSSNTSRHGSSPGPGSNPGPGPGSNPGPILSPANLQPIMKLYQELAAAIQSDRTQTHTSPPPTTFPEGEHFSAMVPSDIQSHIRSATRATQYQHSFTLPSGRTINLCIWFPSSSSSSSLQKSKHLSDMIHCIYAWFVFLDSRVTKPNCSKKLTIYLYMTQLTKKLPNNTPKQELSEINVNSGFTFSCKEQNVIYVFRQEEWLKVLIHESIHALGIDFSWYVPGHATSTAHIQKIFTNVHSSQLSIFEAFTETWAELCVILLQVCIISQNEVYDNDADKQRDLELIIQNCLHYEQGWARIQCVKVLRYYGLTYQELFVQEEGKEKGYHETKTAVFSYYVLKCVLMHHLDAFLTWSTQISHGRGFTYIFASDQEYRKNIDSFCAFLVKWAQDPTYQQVIRNVEEKTKRMYLGDELRMSLWGGEI